MKKLGRMPSWTVVMSDHKAHQKAQPILAAEKRRLEVYQHFSVKPSNNPFSKLGDLGLCSIHSTSRGLDMGRKMGTAEVDLNAFEERLFLTCSD